MKDQVEGEWAGKLKIECDRVEAEVKERLAQDMSDKIAVVQALKDNEAHKKKLENEAEIRKLGTRIARAAERD